MAILIKEKITDWILVNTFRMRFGLKFLKTELMTVEINVAQYVGILISFKPSFGPVKILNLTEVVIGLLGVEGPAMGQLLL